MQYTWKVELVSSWKLQDYLNNLENDDHEIVSLQTSESTVSFSEPSWLVVSKVPVIESRGIRLQLGRSRL